jgi:hypothetical protein
VTWTAYYANTADTFGTLASPTRTQIATGTFTVTSTLTRYSTQISIPAAATTGIEIVFTVGAQTSGTWVIGNVQLEESSIATSFDYRSYPTELAMCLRYFELYDGANLFLTKLREATRDKRANFYYKVTKRISATVTIITSNADGGGAISGTSGIDGGFFESLSTSDGQTPFVSKFSGTAEL